MYLDKFLKTTFKGFYKQEKRSKFVSTFPNKSYIKYHSNKL